MPQHERPIEELKAGDDFRQSMLMRADAANGGIPMWYGWVIMDAFLAGIDWARAQWATPRQARQPEWVRNGTLMGEHTEIDLWHEATDTWVTVKADDARAEKVVDHLLKLLNSEPAI